MFVLKCPKCGNKMKCEPQEGAISGKSKKCVYCGRSFKIKGRVVSES